MESVMQNEKLMDTFKTHHLMLGQGKVTRFENADKIEVHLSPRDYTSLVTQRTHPHDVFSVIRLEKKEQNDDHFGGKGSAVVLPKTYITRSGSLMLYSDNKIMKDKQETVEPGLAKTQTLSVAGKAVPKRTKTGDSYPRWGNLASPRSTATPVKPRTANGKSKTSKREQISYLRDGKEDHQDRPAAVRTPYSWNYAVAPLTKANLARRDDLKTVHGLKEAILTYDYGHMTGSERYANVMCQALKSNDSNDSYNAHGDVEFLNSNSYSHTSNFSHGQYQDIQNHANNHSRSQGSQSRASGHSKSSTSQTYGHMQYRKGQTPRSNFYRNKSPSYRHDSPSPLGDPSRHRRSQQVHPTLSDWTRTWLKTDNLVTFEGQLSPYTSDKYYWEPDMLALERARSNLSRHSKIYDRAPVNTPMSVVHPSTQQKEEFRRRVKSSVTTTQNTQTERKTPTSLSSLADD